MLICVITISDWLEVELQLAHSDNATDSVYTRPQLRCSVPQRRVHSVGHILADGTYHIFLVDTWPSTFEFLDWRRGVLLFNQVTPVVVSGP